jgi:hypothetical protein
MRLLVCRYVADLSNHLIRSITLPIALPPSSFPSDMLSQLDNPQFADVCFLVEGRRIYAHRSQLAARCEYFYSMFTSGFAEAYVVPPPPPPPTGSGGSSSTALATATNSSALERKGASASNPSASASTNSALTSTTTFTSASTTSPSTALATTSNASGAGGGAGPITAAPASNSLGLSGGCIEIQDVKYDVFRTVLVYVYTDECTLSDSVFQVMSIADQYRLDRLKTMCETHVQTVISVRNAVHFYAYVQFPLLCFSLPLFDPDRSVSVGLGVAEQRSDAVQCHAIA